MSVCMWQGREHPRTLRGRHVDDCENDECKGCQPCTEPHCLVCGIEHALGACPSCTGVARDDLASIVRMHSRLRAEMAAMMKVPSYGALEHVPGGIAMFLAGPVANPEANAHVTVHAMHVGLEHWRDELDSDGEPPLSCLAWWEDLWRTLRRDDDADIATVADAAGYLDGVLTWAASDVRTQFDVFARDLRLQTARLEDVLHEGERDDKGAPCMKCGASLIKRYGEKAADDRWHCARCHQVSTPEQYLFAVQTDYLANADRLSATDMGRQYDVKPGTLTGWAAAGKVKRRGRDDDGRRLYDVADVVRMLTRPAPE